MKNEFEEVKKLARHKMNKEDFDLWLHYLATHSRKPTCVDFRKFKKEGSSMV